MAAAAAAATSQTSRAIKASGAIVQVEPDDFLSLLSKIDDPLVVTAKSGFMANSYRYLSAYKGLVFFTKSPRALQLPAGVELITAEKIWVPG